MVCGGWVDVCVAEFVGKFSPRESRHRTTVINLPGGCTINRPKRIADKYRDTVILTFSELGGGFYGNVSHLGHTGRVHDANHVAQPAKAFITQRRVVSGHTNNSRAHIGRIFGQHLCTAPGSTRIRLSAQFFR